MSVAPLLLGDPERLLDVPHRARGRLPLIVPQQGVSTPSRRQAAMRVEPQIRELFPSARRTYW